MKQPMTPEKLAQNAYLKRERMYQIMHIREQANYDEHVVDFAGEPVSLSELAELWVPA